MLKLKDCEMKNVEVESWRLALAFFIPHFSLFIFNFLLTTANPQSDLPIPPYTVILL